MMIVIIKILFIYLFYMKVTKFQKRNKITVGYSRW